MSIKMSFEYLRKFAKVIEVDGITYVAKSNVIEAIDMANVLESFSIAKCLPPSSGYYLVKEYGKIFSKTAYFDSKTQNFKVGGFVLDVEKWAQMPNL